MKTLSCKDLGGNCDFTVQGNTNQEAKEKLLAHAQKEHKDVLAKMSPDDTAKINQKMDALLNAQN